MPKLFSSNYILPFFQRVHKLLHLKLLIPVLIVAVECAKEAITVLKVHLARLNVMLESIVLSRNCRNPVVTVPRVNIVRMALLC